MAALPCTVTGLGRMIELGELPRQRDGLGTDHLILALFKSVGAATDTTLRNCVDYASMLTAGAVACDFSGYAPKVLGPADRDITYVTVGPTFKAILTIDPQVWNPAGGITNNTPVKGVLLYRPDPATPIGSCRPLGIDDCSGGSAAGGTYTHTFSVSTSSAT